MKKGFTLIELLAVIIILAIVALIATPIVLDVVDDARTSAAKSETAMIVSGINNYCATAEMKAQMNNTTSECEEVTKEDVSKMVDLGNAKVTAITYNGKVTSLTVESNRKIVEYDGSTYKIDGEVVGTNPVEPTETYRAYSVGDDVTLIDGTTWVVVKDTALGEEEIKLMSNLNVLSNLTTETGTAMFALESDSANYTISYDSSEADTNVWGNSTLKKYLEETVKDKLEESLEIEISDITIWGAEELTTLGCTVTGNETDGYSAISCDKTTAWYSKVFENSSSYTKLHSAGYSSGRQWVCRNDGSFLDYRNRDYGARPIITVSKSVIEQQQ